MPDALVLDPNDLQIDADIRPDELEALLDDGQAPQVVIPDRELAEGAKVVDGPDLRLEEAIWDPVRHPRWPKGTKDATGKPIGGEYMRAGQTFMHDGKRWEIQAIADGRVIANEASGKIQNTETRVFEPSTATINGEKVPIIKGATMAEPWALHSGKGKYQGAHNTPIVDANVRPETHDPKIKLPKDSDLTAEEWKGFGRADQLYYVELMNRYGKWTHGNQQLVGAPAHLHNKAQQAIAKATKEFGSSDAATIVTDAFSSQKGSSKGYDLDIATVFKHILSGDKTQLLQAWQRYQHARELEQEINGIIAWELYNRVRAPDVSLRHKSQDADQWWTDVIEGKTPLMSGPSSQWSTSHSWGDPNTLAYSVPIRNIVMFTDIAGFEGAYGEHEVTTGNRMKLSPELAAFWTPAQISDGSPIGKWWTGQLKNHPKGGHVVQALAAHLAGKGELPLPPPEADLSITHSGGAKTYHIPPDDFMQMVEKEIKKSPGKTITEKVPVKTLDLKPGDVIEGTTEGLRYLVIADSGTPTGMSYLALGKGAPGNYDSADKKYTFSSWDATRKKVNKHFDIPAPPQQKEIKYDPADWVPEDKKMPISHFDLGDKLRLNGQDWAVAHKSTTKVTLKSLTTPGMEGTVNAGWQTFRLKPLKPFVPVKGALVLVKPHGETPNEIGVVAKTFHDASQVTMLNGEVKTWVNGMLSAPPDLTPGKPQKGDTFSFNGQKMTVTNVLKKDGHVRAKATGGKVQDFKPDHPALASLFRPSDYAIGPKAKAGKLPAGALISASKAKIRPYMVLGTVGTDTHVVNLDTGEHVVFGAKKSYPQLLTAAEAEEPVPQHGDATGKGPGGLTVGDKVAPSQVQPGDIFQSGSMKYQVVSEGPNKTLNLKNLITGQDLPGVGATSDTPAWTYMGHESEQGTPQPLGPGVDVSSLPDAVEHGFAPFKWHKGGGGVQYDKLKDFTEGAVVLDKNGKAWKVKQPGAKPIITDGTSLFAVDGNLRAKDTKYAHHPVPFVDQSPPVGGTAKVAADGMVANTANQTFEELGLQPGDQFTMGDKVWTITSATGFGQWPISATAENGSHDNWSKDGHPTKYLKHGGDAIPAKQLTPGDTFTVQTFGGIGQGAQKWWAKIGPGPYTVTHDDDGDGYIHFTDAAGTPHKFGANSSVGINTQVVVQQPGVAQGTTGNLGMAKIGDLSVGDKFLKPEGLGVTTSWKGNEKGTGPFVVVAKDADPHAGYMTIKDEPTGKTFKIGVTSIAAGNTTVVLSHGEQPTAGLVSEPVKEPFGAPGSPIAANELPAHTVAQKGDQLLYKTNFGKWFPLGSGTASNIKTTKVKPVKVNAPGPDEYSDTGQTVGVHDAPVGSVIQGQSTPGKYMVLAHGAGGTHAMNLTTGEVAFMENSHGNAEVKLLGKPPLEPKITSPTPPATGATTFGDLKIGDHFEAVDGKVWEKTGADKMTLIDKAGGISSEGTSLKASPADEVKPIETATLNDMPAGTTYKVLGGTSAGTLIKKLGDAPGDEITLEMVDPKGTASGKPGDQWTVPKATGNLNPHGVEQVIAHEPQGEWITPKEVTNAAKLGLQVGDVFQSPTTGTWKIIAYDPNASYPFQTMKVADGTKPGVKVGDIKKWSKPLVVKYMHGRAAHDDFPISPYAWHKGGGGIVYDKLSQLPVGATFTDKDGKLFEVVSQHGTTALGHATVKSDAGEQLNVPYHFVDKNGKQKITHVAAVQAKVIPSSALPEEPSSEGWEALPGTPLKELDLGPGDEFITGSGNQYKIVSGTAGGWTVAPSTSALGPGAKAPGAASSFLGGISVAHVKKASVEEPAPNPEMPQGFEKVGEQTDPALMGLHVGDQFIDEDGDLHTVTDNLGPNTIETTWEYHSMPGETGGPLPWTPGELTAQAVKHAPLAPVVPLPTGKPKSTNNAGVVTAFTEGLLAKSSTLHTVKEPDGSTTLYSYGTPIAFMGTTNTKVYLTTEKHSVTTSKHTGQAKTAAENAGHVVHPVGQDELEQMIADAQHPYADQIPAPAEGAIKDYSAGGMKLTDTKPAGGTTGAMFAQDDTGHDFIIKRYGGDQDRVATEALANAVYQTLGVSTPAGGLYDEGGKKAFVAPLVPGEVEHDWTPEMREALAKDYVADALLANYDVHGLERDNILWDPVDHTPYRVDQGGTFFYRAQGKKKPYGPVPEEMWTMLTKGQAGDNGLNEFLSEAELRKQAGEVASKLTPSKIDALVKAAPFSDEFQKAIVAGKLKQRVTWLKQFAAGQHEVPPVVKAMLSDGEEPAGPEMPIKPYLSKQSTGASKIVHIAALKPGEAFRDKNGAKFYVKEQKPFDTLAITETGATILIPGAYMKNGSQKLTFVKQVKQG